MIPDISNMVIQLNYYMPLKIPWASLKNLAVPTAVPVLPAVLGSN